MPRYFVVVDTFAARAMPMSLITRLVSFLQPRYERHPVAMPAVLLALWLCLAVGWRSLGMPDEGRYSVIALDMALHNQWLEPLLNGLPFFHKPPLFYWINGLALKLFGTSCWAARTSSVLIGWMGGMGLYLFVRQHISHKLAWVSLLLLATMPFFFGGAQFANLDMLVGMLIALTVLAGAHAVMQQALGLPHKGWVWLTWVFAALGILAKGLIGAALPAAVLLLWLLWQRHWRGLWVLLLSLPGAVLFALIAVPWVVLVQQRYPGFAYYFFIEQQFHRFSGGEFNNQQGWWFYPALLFGMGLPTSVWLLPALWRNMRGNGQGLGAQSMQGRLKQMGRVLPVASPASALRLLWCWLGFVVVFFSIPTSKTVGYILPAVPPLAVLFALWLQTAQGLWPIKRLAGMALGGAALCLTLTGIFTAIPRSSIYSVVPSMRAAIAPQDTIVMIDNFQFDMPFYLSWHKPVLLVADWDNPVHRQSDGWRNYMLDAADFSPKAAEQIMIRNEHLPAHLCATAPAGSSVWVLAPQWYGDKLPYLLPEQLFWTQPKRPGGLQMWRVQGAQARALLGCK